MERRNSHAASLLLVLLLVQTMIMSSNGFSLVMMGVRRGKGNLGKSLDPYSVGDKQSTAQDKVKSMNSGRGQEITGVTLPRNGELRGWQFGEKQTMVSTNMQGTFYALQGVCPRCGFDLFKGDLLTDGEVFKDVPRVACPTCATTYSFRTGKPGPPLKRTGLAGFVTGLAKTATINDEYAEAKTFFITADSDTGQVFCREK